jgi:hypothetical protein
MLVIMNTKTSTPVHRDQHERLTPAYSDARFCCRGVEVDDSSGGVELLMQSHKIEEQQEST